MFTKIFPLVNNEQAKAFLTSLAESRRLSSGDRTVFSNFYLIADPWVRYVSSWELPTVKLLSLRKCTILKTWRDGEILISDPESANWNHPCSAITIFPDTKMLLTSASIRKGHNSRSPS